MGWFKREEAQARREHPAIAKILTYQDKSGRFRKDIEALWDIRGTKKSPHSYASKLMAKINNTGSSLVFNYVNLQLDLFVDYEEMKKLEKEPVVLFLAVMELFEYPVFAIETLEREGSDINLELKMYSIEGKSHQIKINYWCRDRWHDLYPNSLSDLKRAIDDYSLNPKAHKINEIVKEAREDLKDGQDNVVGFKRADTSGVRETFPGTKICSKATNANIEELTFDEFRKIHLRNDLY